MKTLSRLFEIISFALYGGKPLNVCYQSRDFWLYLKTTNDNKTIKQQLKFKHYENLQRKHNTSKL